MACSQQEQVIYEYIYLLCKIKNMQRKMFVMCVLTSCFGVTNTIRNCVKKIYGIPAKCRIPDNLFA